MRYSIYRFGFATLFYAVLFLTTAEEVSSNQKSNEFDEYVYYQGVQGRPGIDFPVFARIPRTGFSCKQVPSGYYADLETDCQVFHICNEGSKISFLCPNGTIFQQSDLICEWWFKVNCTNSPNLYEESAEQLLEESWRRKENRRPGYQNRLANEEKEKKKNFVVNNPSKRKNLDQNEQSQGRGNQKYKRPINLKGKNDLNLEDSSEESQVLAETASFYDNNGNNNNQNVIHGTEKIGVGRKQKINRGRNQNLNQPNSNDQNLSYNGRKFNKGDQNSRNLNQNGRKLNQNGRKFNQDDQKEVKLNQNDENLNYNGRKFNQPSSNDQNGRNLNQNGQILSQNDQNLNHNGRKFNQPGSNDQNGGNLNENGRNFKQSDQIEVKLNQNDQILSQNDQNLNYNGRKFNHPGSNDQNGRNLNQFGRNLNQNGRNLNQNGRNLNQNGRNLHQDGQREVKPNQNGQVLSQNDQNLNHNGRKFNQPSSNDQNGRNLNQNGRNLSQNDENLNHDGRNFNQPSSNEQNVNKNGRNFNQDGQSEVKIIQNGRKFNQPSFNDENGRNLNQNGRNFNENGQREVKHNQNGQTLSQNGRDLNQNNRKFNQGEQKEVNLSQNGRNLNHNGRNFNQPSSNDQNEQKLNQNFNQDGQNDQHFNENGRNLYQPNSNDQNRQNLNQNGRKLNQDDQSEVELNQNGRDLSRNGKSFNQNDQSDLKLIENGQNLNQDGSNFYQSNPNLSQNDANLKSSLYNHNLNHDSNQNVHLNTEIDDVLSKKSEKSKINTENNPFINQENDQNRPQYRNHKTTQELNNNPTVTFTRSETQQYFDEFTTESIQKSTNYNLNEFITTEYNQEFSTNQFTTNKPFETTQNDQNQYQDQRKEESLTTKEFYPNHKEVYTEVREPKFLSTKAYTTGTQTIPPQTVSTNRIPLNDGKPFVVSTPKSSYNIKEFTTENFFYSPTIPPFTTTTKNFLFNQNTLSNSNQEKDGEEITVSEPYSNVVTENVNQNKINLRFGDENEKIHVVNSIPVITESANKTEFVRISSSLPQKEKPDRIKINVSTNLQKPDNQNPSSESSPIVYRRYSAAISQAENPNNACLDEIVNRKGTTKAPKMTKAPKTTKKPDFEVVVGRKRTENDSKVFKISKYPDIQKPRSFEKATESSIYRVNVKNQEIERVTENNFSLKPTGFYVTKSYNDNQEGTTRFGAGNTYLPKSTTPNSNSLSNRKKSKSLLIKSNDEDFNVNDFDIIQKPKPFELPPKLTSNFSTKSNLITTDSSPNYEISSARPFETTITPTQPTIFPPRTPKVYEHVTNMLTSIKDLIKLNKNETDEESREGLIVPPSAGPQTLHSLAVYFANALEGVENFSQNDDEVTTEQIEEENKSKDIELLSIPTLNRYKDLFKEDDETTQSVTEDNDLEGQHTKNGVVTPRVRQLAQVFTKALSSYLDDPEMFRKYLQDVRPTEPTIKENFRTTQRSVDNTEEDELLNYSDADIKPELPKLSTTTPAISPTWGYLLAKNNSNNFEYNSLSTDGENLQSADSQSFVSQFNNYIKEKHFAPNTTPLSNKDNLFKDKLYSHPLAINDDLDGTKSTEINYELRTLPKIELNSTQVHGILIDFMNTTTNNENSRLNRILSKLNTTQDEFLSKMREIEQNPLTRRLILLLISECAGNVTDHNDGDVSSSENKLKLDLFDSSRIAENDKHVSKNSAIPKFVDQTLKDEDEDTRALELLNSLYTIASRYGK